MINKLFLKNFKCFNEIELRFSAINILTGLNGMRKSTVMQGILLLDQSQKSIISEEVLSLNGKYINLGIGRDILFEKAERDEIGITLQVDQKNETFCFAYDAEADVLPLKKISMEGKMSDFKGWADKLFYLSAYRIEPQFFYQIENEKELSERYFGKNGEFAIQYLKLHGGDEVKNKALIGNC